MSAPAMPDPLAVNTSDNRCWVRQAYDRNGHALYALADSVEQQPSLWTIRELSELGLHGMTNALPVPVGPGLRTLDVVEHELTGANLALYEERLETARLRLALASAQRGRRQQRDRAAALLEERHSTNESVDDASTALRRLRDRIAELEAQRDRRRVRLVQLQNDALNMRGALSPNGERRKVPMPLGDALTPAVEWLVNRVAQLESAPTVVYRAEHPDSGITLGHYGTEAAAREHCETTERRSWPAGTTLVFDWIEDDEDRVAELVVTAGQNEESTTGYLVTALEIPSEYDAEADE